MVFPAIAKQRVGVRMHEMWLNPVSGPRNTLTVGVADTFHERASAAGRCEVRTCPALSTAAQNEIVGHDTAEMVAVWSTWLRLQLAVREPRLVEVITPPALSPATHSDFDAHETAVKLSMPPLHALSRLRCHAELPPVGCFEVIAATSGDLAVNPSTAQNDLDAQETLLSPPPGLTPTVRDVQDPPAGFVEVKTWPPIKSTATQNDRDGQEMPSRYDLQNAAEHDSTGVALHAPAPPAGSVEVTTSPS